MTTSPEAGAADEAAPDDELQALWDEDEGPAQAEPEPEPVSGEDFTDDEAPAARPAAPQSARSADIWANADPALIAWRDQMLAEKATTEQRHRSEAGRVAAYQRRYEEERRLRLSTAPEQTAEPEDDSDLEAAAEEYPDVVNPLMRRLDRQNAVIEAMQQDARSREAFAAAERDAFQAAEEAKLTARHANWLDLTTTDDGAGGRTAAPEFAAWVRHQPAEMQAKVQRNAEGITSAEEASQVISAFAAFMARFDEAAPHNSPSDRRRQRQLDASKAVSSRPQVATGGSVPKNGDPEAIWAEEDRIHAAKQARR